MSDFKLALAFDTDDPEFARGVEVGSWWARVQSAKSNSVSGYAHGRNSEMLMRIAESQGWVCKAEVIDDFDNLWVTMERKPK